MIVKYFVAMMFVAQIPSVDELVFVEPLANLGELRSYLSSEHAFAFRNQGREVIEIVAVELHSVHDDGLRIEEAEIVKVFDRR